MSAGSRAFPADCDRAAAGRRVADDETAARELDDEGACGVCGDVGVEARVISIDGETATVEEERTGRRRPGVALDFVPDAAVGQRLVVHMGVAIGRVREDK